MEVSQHQRLTTINKMDLEELLDTQQSCLVGQYQVAKRSEEVISE